MLNPIFPSSFLTGVFRRFRPPSRRVAIRVTLAATRSLLTELEFCAWLGQAQPGEVVHYHIGFLALDTVEHVSRLDEWARRELVRLGRRAFWAAERSFVHLVQRRIGPNAFAYIAIARPHRAPRPIPLNILIPEEAA